jgi:hypothetical protein
MSRIFISYKRANKDLVMPIRERIELSLGEPCWIDMEGIESDAQFVNVIMQAIDDAEIFLFMYSKEHSRILDYDKDWTVREINYAHAEGKRIVFVNIDQTPLTKWFKFMFGLKQQVDATSPEALNHLIVDLRHWLHIPDVESQPAPAHSPALKPKTAPKPEPKPVPQPEPSAPRFCRRCGTPLTPGAAFCKRCGTKILR